MLVWERRGVNSLALYKPNYRILGGWWIVLVVDSVGGGKWWWWIVLVVGLESHFSVQFKPGLNNNHLRKLERYVLPAGKDAMSLG